MWKIIFLEKIVFPLRCHDFANLQKIRLPEIPPNMARLHKYRKSSEMVVRGWYMTHFDRRNVLNSEKLGFGRFRTFSDHQRSIFDFSMFFPRILPNFKCPEKPVFSWSESQKRGGKWFFANFFDFFWNYDTLAPIWYFYFVRTPNTSKTPRFGNLVVRFFLLMCISLFWKPLIYIIHLILSL